MANDSLRLSAEMAAALGFEAHGDHTRDEIGAAVVRRFGTESDRPVPQLDSLPVHELGELVVLLDAGGCGDVDAAVQTALASDDSGATRAPAHAVATDLCGELAERRFMP